MSPATLRILLCLCAAATPGFGDGAPSTWDLDGFAILEAASSAEGTQRIDELAAQAQVGVNWSPSLRFSAHAHLIGRTDEGDAERGNLGLAAAYLETVLSPADGRLRLRIGAFFLPTSLENVDALWENPYSISSSALNTWLGEELRPVGIDASYSRRGAMIGATVFRGNDTLGALPPVRGWALGDRWTLLGEKLEVDGEYYTSVSADTDGRLGWSARAGWGNQRFKFQYTYLDNRSDGLAYGDLFNWNTRFQIAAAGISFGPWTIAAEKGWGPTYLIVDGQRYVSDIAASYLLLSRRVGRARAFVRFDVYDNGERTGHATTAALIWAITKQLKVKTEVLRADDETRGRVQLRYGFGAPR